MANPELGPGGSPSLRATAKVTAETRKLNETLEKFGQVFQSDMDKLVRSTTLGLVGATQRRCPVATGRARASIHATFAGEPDAFTYSDNRGHSFDGALGQSATKPGTAVFGSNVEYMPPLEAGWSKQAPSGMFRISLAEYTANLLAQVKAYLGKTTKA